jgi:hypothetical protein
MTFRLTIDTGNAAFHDDDGNPDPAPELGRILRQIADGIDAGPMYQNCPSIDGTAYDVNGNTVARWTYEEDQ